MPSIMPARHTCNRLIKRFQLLLCKTRVSDYMCGLHPFQATEHREGPIRTTITLLPEPPPPKCPYTNRCKT